MPILFARSWSRREIQERFPDIQQLIRLQRATLREGRAEGVDVVEVATASGFEFTVAPGRCLDITQARYKGIPLCWRSYTGDVAAPYFEPEGLGWTGGMAGGLLATGGLTYMGGPTVDQGQALGLHGRVSYVPATGVYADGGWEGDTYRMWIRGSMSEAAALGPNIVLTREISTEAGASYFIIHDTVENRTFQPIEHMMLYHFNIGAPILSENAQLLLNSEEVLARDDDSLLGLPTWDRFDPPQPGRPHQLFYHRLRADDEGMAHVLLVARQEAMPIGLSVTYSAEALPWFINWKSMAAGTYVTGLEPANAWVQGRAVERAANRLHFLQPWQSVQYTIRFGVLEGEDAIRAFAAAHRLTGSGAQSTHLAQRTAVELEQR